MDDIERRLISLEKNSEHYKEQFEMYCLSHKDEHRQTIERIEKVETLAGSLTSEIGKMSTSIALILAATTSNDKDKETRRIMYGTISAAVIAALASIVQVFFPGGIR